MAFYDALIAKWPSVTGADTATKIANLNALTATGSAQVAILSTYKIYNAIVPADFTALTAAQQQQVRDILNMGTVDASPGTQVRAVLQSIFAGKATLTNLAALVASYDSPQGPWWLANGYTRPFHTGDIVVAGLDQATGYSVVLSAPVSSRFNVSITATATGPRSSESDTMVANIMTTDTAKIFAAGVVHNMMVRDGSLSSLGS